MKTNFFFVIQVDWLCLKLKTKDQNVYDFDLKVYSEMAFHINLLEMNKAFKQKFIKNYQQNSSKKSSKNEILTEIHSRNIKEKVNSKNLNTFTKNNLSPHHNNKSNSKLRAMLKLQLGLTLFTNIQIIVLVPVYLCLSPLCMISSSLFDWTMKHIIDDQTITLIAILVLEWTVSLVLIFQLIRDRTGKAIFFYEFVFFLTCSNFILIGVTYSLLQRNNIYEELAAKICTSLLLILLAEKVKLRYEQEDHEESCTICFQKMKNDCMVLKCKHEFHEKCLWNWVYVKQECPYCRSQI